ncbi:Ig-like domain-containing protein [Lentibacillus sp. N15]|uniref:Ig-like domain-containing protein n=1 Tax=Lentibacillus songyuanensis TaxID=3136161 RepID=UPI0031BA94D7
MRLVILWYEITPANEDITANTHIRLKVSSEAAFQIKVYPSKEKADNDDTFARYQAFTSDKQPAELDFPYAWDGPYYMKVVYLGDEENEEPTANPEPVDYQINYEAIKLPPADLMDEPCLVELSAAQKKSGAEIISELRLVRDELLEKTDKGRELTDLYYDASPHLVANMLFDSILRAIGADTNGTAKTSIKVVVKKGTPPPAPEVKSVSNKSTVVTGKTLADLKVTIKNKLKKVIATGNADSKGNFKVKVKKQKAGTTLYVTVTDPAKRQSKAKKVVVQDKIPPQAPKANAITTRDTALKGKTEAHATITVKHKDKKIAAKKADSKGNFKVKIKKQKAGTVLYITATDKAGNTSKAKKMTVKKDKKK